jgi:TolB-like protein
VPVSPWARIKEHKVLQWSIAYLGAALALAHGQELLAHTYHWPEVVGRILMAMLIVGFPPAIALAWYHGHRGLTRFSAAEMTVVSLLLVIGAGLLMVLVRPGEGQGSAKSVTTTASQPATETISTPAASVAVVPFANLTGDASKDYFSDGMAEELINALAHIPGLKVPARTSSFAYKGRNVDIRQIARDLGVSTILEGSVRSAGERIRVSAELVDARTGYHIWSETYDKQFADIFKIQDELAATIVQALSAHVNSAVRAPQARPRPTRDLEAYQLYLQARSVGRGNEEGFRRAISLYDEALARDPGLARAWAGRAQARTVLFVISDFSLEGLESAERDARRALALDASLAEAHEALGMTASRRREWTQARASFQAAIQADPTDAQVRARRAAWLSAPVGRLRDAYTELAEAYRVAPADPLVVMLRAGAASTLGLDSEAVSLADLAEELGASGGSCPLECVYIAAAMRSGRYDEASKRAVEVLSAPVRKAGADEVVRAAFSSLAFPGNKPAAARALQDLLRRIRPVDVDRASRDLFVQLLVMLGAMDAAYQASDEFERSGPVITAGLAWRPEMRPFRTDPRFQKLVARLNLLSYWKQYGAPDECDIQGERLICH